jgi:deoxyribonuclease-4
MAPKKRRGTKRATRPTPKPPRGARKKSAKKRSAPATTRERRAPKRAPAPTAKPLPKRSPKPRPKSTRAVTVPKPGTIPRSAGPSPYETPYAGAPLGAHVSTSGGVANGPPRGSDIGATAIQLFTKQASQWKERLVDDAEAQAFRAALAQTPVAFTNAHDSYLINLASPNPELRARSIASFECEMRRSNALGLDAVVSHPGNFMDDRASGIARNADAVTEVLERVSGPTRLLMELTAGQGTVIGSTFEEMAELLARLPASLQPRVGVCLDTAHVFAAGYDLVGDYDGVIARFADVLGVHRLGLLHLNDSKAPLGSRKDRHELIGAGTIGDAPFRRIMTDPRLAAIPKVLETPKGDDMVSNDRAMLRKLRGFAAGA